MSTTEHALIQKLHQLNKAYSKGKEAIPATGNEDYNSRLCDIEHEPHLFLIACLMDRQIRAEHAWTIPFWLENKLGKATMPHLASLSLKKIEDAMDSMPKRHRLWREQSKLLWRMAKKVGSEYSGDPQLIWKAGDSCAAVIRRFLEFDGIGPKIATMATNILVRDFGVSLTHTCFIDISVDVQVRRVFQAMGLSRTAEDWEIIYRARELCPNYPGELDLPLWVIGRGFCNEKWGKCSNESGMICPVFEYCPSGGG